MRRVVERCYVSEAEVRVLKERGGLSGGVGRDCGCGDGCGGRSVGAGRVLDEVRLMAMAMSMLMSSSSVQQARRRPRVLPCSDTYACSCSFSVQRVCTCSPHLAPRLADTSASASAAALAAPPGHFDCDGGSGHTSWRVGRAASRAWYRGAGRSREWSGGRAGRARRGGWASLCEREWVV